MNKYFIIILFSLSSKVFAGGVDFGLSMLEQGDDRYQPGVSLQANSKTWLLQGHLFARKFHAVQESIHVVNISRLVNLPKITFIKAALGLSVLHTRTKITYRSEHKKFEQDHTQFNVGGHVAFFWHKDLGKRYYTRANWTASIFPAGLNGLILLATGRMHTLGISIGMHL